jgi:GT2 family glycosyltransferase
VRVVLVNYRSAADVRRRLSSDALRDADVVVVDNGSEPDDVQALCKEYGATAVLLDANVGFAAGVNAAWERCRGRPALPLLLLNPDAELTAGGLDTLLSELDVPGTTGVAPLLAEPSGRLQVGAAGGPVTVRSVVAYFLLGAHLLPRWRGVLLTRRQSRTADRVSWLCMACLLLTPDALDRFGPLPEDEIVYAEDVAWGGAATGRGAVLRLVPRLVVTHPHGSSGGSSAWARSFERLLLRRLGPVRGRVAVAAMRTGLAVRRLAGRHVDG